MSQNFQKLSRRTLFAGASTAGALAAVATALPRVSGDAAPVAVKPPPPERGGGYHLSEHVKRYYKTTMV